MELVGRPIKVGRAVLSGPTSTPTASPLLTSFLQPSLATPLNLSPALSANTALALAQRKTEDLLSSEENLTITSNQRYLIMQKLARGEIKVCNLMALKF
jgi:hypothetical protein